MQPTPSWAHQRRPERGRSDEEIKGLQNLSKRIRVRKIKRNQYKRIAALVPSPSPSVAIRNSFEPRVRQNSLPSGTPSENTSGTASNSSNQGPIVPITNNSQARAILYSEYASN